MTTTSQAGNAPGVEEASDPQQLREQIEETRAELGRTVEALAAKADVKARVAEKVSAGREQVKEKVSAASPVAPVVAVVAVGLIMAFWLIRRRK
jgi:hypothetical protein